jgi:transmembrane sensor
MGSQNSYMEQDYVWNLIAKKLSGECTQDEQRELESLLRKNPDLHYSMQTIIDLWNSENEPDHEAARKAFNHHVERMSKLNIDFSTPTDSDVETTTLTYPDQNSGNNTKKRVLWMSLSFATISLIIFGIKTSSSNNNLSAQSNTGVRAVSEISTKNGSKTSLTLPDGTLVKLNAGSSITYNGKEYGNTIREVNLTGEAFFDVVKNPEKPFIIHTNKINIRVLGTAFNVKSYPGEKNSETSLIRGSLEVTVKDRPAEKYILKPNEKLVVANEEILKVPVTVKKEEKKWVVQEPIVALKHLTYQTKDSTVIETSWVENKLIFQDQNFKDLASQMERWYAVTISFKDAEQEEMRFTGVFQNETIQQALEALKLTNRFNYIISGTRITILK